MKKLQILPSLIWLIAGMVVATASLKMRVGTLQSPGPGLMPLCLSVLLIGLSLILIVTEFRSSAGSIEVGNLRRPALIGTALLGYAIVLPAAGFFLTTCVFVFVLLVTLDNRPWLNAAALAVAVGAVCQVVFVRWLDVEMPHGTWLGWFG